MVSPLTINILDIRAHLKSFELAKEKRPWRRALILPRESYLCIILMRRGTHQLRARGKRKEFKVARSVCVRGELDKALIILSVKALGVSKTIK